MRTPVLAKHPERIEDLSDVFGNALKSDRVFARRYREAGLDLSEDEQDRISDVFIKLSQLDEHLVDVVHIHRGADPRLVADVFVRINSEGVGLTGRRTR